MACERLRVGVIGAGRMGERHCRVYSSLNSVELMGVCDSSLERGRAVATAYDAEFFGNCERLLDRVQAVSVATPTGSHFEIVSECIRRGIHVLVEKPLAGTVAEARALVRLARGAPVVVQVGHIERFNPVFLELQGILEDLPIVGLEIRRLSPFDTSNTDVDVVFDLMIHDVDMVLSLLGDEVRHIHAHGRHARTTGVDYAVANISFRDGAIATLTASRVTEQKVRIIEITTIGAYLEADLLNKSISIYRRVMPEYLSNHQRPLRYRQEGLVERIHIPTAEPLMLELQHFARCVTEVGRTAVPIEDGLRAMEVAARIRSQVVGDMEEKRTARNGRRKADPNLSAIEIPEALWAV